MLRGPRSGGRPTQPPSQSWLQDPDRPSIVSATELKELDNLDTEADEGWAGENDSWMFLGIFFGSWLRKNWVVKCTL